MGRAPTDRRSARNAPHVVTYATRVNFSIKKQVAFGEEHRIVGNVKALGEWDYHHAPKMRWNKGDVWTLQLDLPANEPVEFKCVKIADNDAEWESAVNRHLQVSASGICNVDFRWNKDDLHVTMEQPPNVPTGNGLHLPSAEEQGGRSVSSQKEMSSLDSNGKPTEEDAVFGNQKGTGEEDDRPGHLLWRGRETTFMSSNEHSKDRTGVWDTSKVDGSARDLVAGDEKAASWLAKMQLLRRTLVEEAHGLHNLDTLSNVYIYLQWINSGAIECKEGGGHYRPNKHAELAREMFRTLERAIDSQDSEPLIKLLARKVHTKLPSFTAEFTQSTPLTRIRDIAHRNDIPHDLKREIKHTIQNKLHRNAGPEDLVATETMLKRITSDGSFNPSFVAEFKKFRDELRDFFNAATFTSMLESLRPAFEGSEIQVLDDFLRAKIDADKAEDLQKLITALHTLTSLRACILARLSSGLRNDASDSAMAMRQRFRLSEIRAEDVAFVLVSRIVNCLSNKNSQDGLASKSDASWSLPLGAMVLITRQLGLGGWMQAECLAIENELGTWQQHAKFSERLPALRLKATLDRVHRLAQSYTESLLDLFAVRSSRLGSAFGLPAELVNVFAEAEIRASLMFQTSKLCTVLLQAIRKVTGDAGWDVVVGGAARGHLVEVGQIDPEILSNLEKSTVLLVKAASGDEEIGGFKENLKGIILAQSLPHLSHLGIRARQEGVVFVTFEEDQLQELVPLKGEYVQLQAATGAVHLTVSSADADLYNVSSNSTTTIERAQPSLQVKTQIGPTKLSSATIESCGAKAASSAQLAQLAQKHNFETPAGYCLPFGNMEHALQETGRYDEASRLISDLETAELQGGRLDSICADLIHLIESCSLPKACQDSSFAKDPSLLIARSSANVEDLAGMSAAGLYDSIGGVHSDASGELQAAVTKVWASLYTRRAVLARRAAGVPQSSAQMAVLIQEQLEPEYAFVLHTRDPVEQDSRDVYAEIAPGLGETLASGIRGSPWRLKIDRDTGEVKIMAFANFSMALHGASLKPQANAIESKKMYHSSVVDYTKQLLSCDFESLVVLGQKLKDLGLALEQAFQAPQDVEGVVIGNKLFVVQSRPQP